MRKKTILPFPVRKNQRKKLKENFTIKAFYQANVRHVWEGSLWRHWRIKEVVDPRGGDEVKKAQSTVVIWSRIDGRGLRAGSLAIGASSVLRWYGWSCLCCGVVANSKLAIFLFVVFLFKFIRLSWKVRCIAAQSLEGYRLLFTIIELQQITMRFTDHRAK